MLNTQGLWPSTAANQLRLLLALQVSPGVSENSDGEGAAPQSTREAGHNRPSRP